MPATFEYHPGTLLRMRSRGIFGLRACAAHYADGTPSTKAEQVGLRECLLSP